MGWRRGVPPPQPLPLADCDELLPRELFTTLPAQLPNEVVIGVPHATVADRREAGREELLVEAFTQLVEGVRLRPDPERAQDPAEGLVIGKLEVVAEGLADLPHLAAIRA